MFSGYLEDGMRPLLLLTAAVVLLNFLPHAARAQSDSLADCFPLAEGNRWVYGWYGYYDPKLDVTTIDTGTVEYTVSHKIVAADSIRWFLWQRRNLRHGPPGYDWMGAWRDIKDSGFVEIVEKLEGRHQLFVVPEGSGYGLVGPLAFFRTYYTAYYTVDSGKVFRYNKVGTDGIFLQTLPWTPGFGGSTFYYTFRRELGLERLRQGGYYPSDNWNSDHVLREVSFPGDGVAICDPSSRSFAVRAALGQTAERVVTVNNPGTGTLHLAVSCNNPHFDLILDQPFVPANSNTPLHIRYLYTAAMADTARIILTSNAATSLDTIIFVVSASLSTDTSGRPPETKPESFALEQNFPNPFNVQTNIRFNIPSPAHVTLKVFDLLGQNVATITEENLGPGSYGRTFSGSKLSSGVYFYRLQAGDFLQVRRMILMR